MKRFLVKLSNRRPFLKKFFYFFLITTAAILGVNYLISPNKTVSCQVNLLFKSNTPISLSALSRIEDRSASALTSFSLIKKSYFNANENNVFFFDRLLHRNRLVLFCLANNPSACRKNFSEYYLFILKETPYILGETTITEDSYRCFQSNTSHILVTFVTFVFSAALISVLFLVFKIVKKND